MAADVYGTAAGEAHTSSASWTCSTPAGLSGHRLLLALAVVNKSSPPNTPSGWVARPSKAHSAAPGGVWTFEKVLTSSVSAGTVTVTFPAAVVGVSGCIAIDGQYDSAATPSETGWTGSATPPSGVASEDDGVMIVVAATTQFPRGWSIAAPSVEMFDVPGPTGTPPEIPGLLIAKKLVDFGTTAANLVSTVNPYAGFGNDEQYVMLTLVYKSVAAAAPPPSGTQVTFIGFPTTVDIGGTSVDVTVRGGEEDDAQYVVLNHSAAGSATVTPAAGFAQISVSDVDSSIGRLALYERILTGTTGDTTQTFGFSTSVVGVAGSFTVRGARVDLQRNAATQSTYLLTATPPSVTVPTGLAMVVTIVGSGNFQRSQTPGAGVTEQVDNWPADGPSLAIGSQTVGSGAHYLAPWTPADPATPGAEAGDYWRLITLGFVPLGASGGGGNSVTGSGNWAYVAAPVGLVVTPTGDTTATATWQDSSTDETSFEYSYVLQSEGFGALSSLAAGTQSLSIFGLVAGATYKMILAAKRSNDYSAYTQTAVWTQSGALTVPTLASSAVALSIGDSFTVTLTTTPAVATQPIVWYLTGPATATSASTLTSGGGTGTLVATATGAGVLSVLAEVAGIQTGYVSIVVGAADETPVLTVSPARLEANQVITARVTGDLGGAAFVGQSVSLASSNTSVALSPSSRLVESTIAGGEAVFTLPAIANGTTTLTATINGEASNAVAVVVADPSPPVDYTASGVTSVAIHIEAPLAAASRPRIRRMTHADQQFYHPGDDGFKFANSVALKEHVFFTASKFR